MNRLARYGVMLGLLAGCSRAYYRQSADRETYPIIAERIASPESGVGRTRVEPSPQSRLSDPTRPDNPAKPPDDSVAAPYMNGPNGLPAYKHWDKDGVVDTIEPVGWESTLPRNEQGSVRLTQTNSFELALLHSREYQTRLENVYLSALALTLNRFDFDCRWFGRTGPTYQYVGAGPTHTLTQSSALDFNRDYAAGGQLLVDFANSFVWEFSGRTHTANSSFGATLVQPLLRGFGRDIRLETLTQSERDVLYSVRDFARFRKQFWAGIAVEGYLQLLNSVQAVRNAKANVKSQEINNALYQTLFRGGKVEATEVEQVYLGLLSARSDLIGREIELQNSLDRFKLQLGLPPRLPIEIDDSRLEQFRLSDESVEQLRDELDQFDRAKKAQLDALPDAAGLAKNYDEMAVFLPRIRTAIDAAASAVKQWETDLKNQKSDPDQAEALEKERKELERFKDRPKELTERLAAVTAEIAKRKATIDPKNLRDSWDINMATIAELAAILDRSMNLESTARTYLIRLPNIDFDENSAIEYAKEHRLDVLTARAQVTDAWRKVRVAANALESDLTLTVGGRIGTEPGSKNPVDFSADGSTATVGVQFDGPLNRQAERNAYRASQIVYQRARRADMQINDQVELDVRAALRELKAQRLNFEINRQQLLAAVRSLDLERRTLTAPATERGNRGGNNAALRILQSQNQLLAARNRLTSLLFIYEAQRVRLLITLEALTLDDQGIPANDPAQFTLPARQK